MTNPPRRPRTNDELRAPEREPGPEPGPEAQRTLEKKVASRAAAELVEDGMLVGLGTGSTVAHLLDAIAERDLNIRCVATSPTTERAAKRLGLQVVPLGSHPLDLAIDGADQIAPDGWLIKGGGAAHTREKIVASSARRFVVIADSSKLVERLRPPVPLELMSFGLESTLRRLGSVRLRDVASSPDGGIIADYLGEVDAPAELSAFFSRTPGVVEHGLFPPEMTATALIGRGQSVERLDIAPLGASG